MVELSPFSGLGILANENLVSKISKEPLCYAHEILRVVWNQYVDDLIKIWLTYTNIWSNYAPISDLA